MKLLVEVGGHVFCLFPNSVDYLFIPNISGAQRIIEGINLPLVPTVSPPIPFIIKGVSAGLASLRVTLDSTLGLP